MASLGLFPADDSQFSSPVTFPPSDPFLRLFREKSCPLASSLQAPTLCHHFPSSCLRTRSFGHTSYRPDGGFLSLSILLALAHSRQGHQPPAKTPASPGTDIPKTMARAAPHAHARNRSHSFALMGTWRRPHGAAAPPPSLKYEYSKRHYYTYRVSPGLHRTKQPADRDAKPPHQGGPGLQDQALYFPFRHLHTHLCGVRCSVDRDRCRSSRRIQVKPSAPHLTLSLTYVGTYIQTATSPAPPTDVGITPFQIDLPYCVG
jgi:hypothetical protein